MRVCACVCVCMLEVGGEGAVRWTRENVRSWGLEGDLCTGRDGRMGAVGRSMNVGLGMGSLPGPTLCMDVCGSASLVNHAFATLPSCLCPDRLRLTFNLYFEIKTAALG